jgi:large repetitive protein
VRIIPVETHPKRIAPLSNTPPAVGPAARFDRRGNRIPAQHLAAGALLRNFVIRDELPAGLRCSEAPAVNLMRRLIPMRRLQSGRHHHPTCTVTWSNGISATSA